MKYSVLIFFLISVKITSSQNPSQGKFSKFDAYCIYNHNNTIYAGGQNTIYISNDNGKNWNDSIFIPDGFIYALNAKNDTVYAACRRSNLNNDKSATLILIYKNKIISKVISKKKNDFYFNAIEFIGDSIILATEKNLFLNNLDSEIKTPKNDKFKNVGKYTNNYISCIKPYKNKFIIPLTSRLYIVDSTFTSFKLIADAKEILFKKEYSDGSYRIDDIITYNDSILFVNDLGLYSYSYLTDSAKIISANNQTYINSNMVKYKNGILFSTYNKGLMYFNLQTNTFVPLDSRFGSENSFPPIYNFILSNNCVILVTTKGIYYYDNL